MVRRLVESGVIGRAGHYRQAYRNLPGRSAFRVALYKLGRLRPSILCDCLLRDIQDLSLVADRSIFSGNAPAATTDKPASAAAHVDRPGSGRSARSVAGIEEKMNDLFADGRWARAGKLLAAADCEYGDPAPFFAPWGDAATYMLAPQGDPSDTDGWTLNKHASVAYAADPFSGAAPSVILPMRMNMLALASPSGLTAGAFRFKAVGLQKDETLSISSVYVDPFRTR